MPKTAIPLLFVSGLLLATASKVDADVVYTVLNPANNFTLFVYDSPTFITTDTMVGVAQLAFANPLNPITGVDFIPSSSTFPGTSEVDLLQVGAPDQFRYYPQGTFTHFGVTPGDSNSFGFPNSELSVAPAPEPSSIALLAAGLLAWPIRSAPQVQEKTVGSPEVAGQRQWHVARRVG